MIYKFNEFLNERMGFPTVLESYYKVVNKKLNELVKNYFDRKGKLANYKISEEISYDEIKEFVSDEEFIKFPIEKMRLDFYIKLIKDLDKISYDATYWGQSFRRCPRGEETLYIKSESGLIDKALDVRMEFTIRIPRTIDMIRSTDIDKIMLDNITHELFHAYDEYTKKQKKIYWGGVWADVRDMMSDDPNLKKMMKSTSIYNFFWWLYTTEDIEVRANIASLGLMKFKTLNDLKKSTVWKDYVKQKFDAEEEAKNSMRDLKRYCGEDADYYYDNFGKILIQKYRSFTHSTRIERENEILELDGKNLLEVYQYFEPYIHHICDYVKRKVSKLVGNYPVVDDEIEEEIEEGRKNNMIKKFDEFLNEGLNKLIEPGHFSEEYLNWVKTSGMSNLTNTQHKFAEFLLQNKEALTDVAVLDKIFNSVRNYVKEN